MRHLTVQQISASLDGALSGVSLELVVRHLSSCRECRDRHARLSKQDDALRRLLAWEPDEAWHEDAAVRLEKVLDAEMRGVPAPNEARPPEWNLYVLPVVSAELVIDEPPPAAPAEDRELLSFESLIRELSGRPGLGPSAASDETEVPGASIEELLSPAPLVPIELPASPPALPAAEPVAEEPPPFVPLAPGDPLAQAHDAPLVDLPGVELEPEPEPEPEPELEPEAKPAPEPEPELAPEPALAPARAEQASPTLDWESWREPAPPPLPPLPVVEYEAPRRTSRPLPLAMVGGVLMVILLTGWFVLEALPPVIRLPVPHLPRIELVRPQAQPRPAAIPAPPRPDVIRAPTTRPAARKPIVFAAPKPPRSAPAIPIAPVRNTASATTRAHAQATVPARVTPPAATPAPSPVPAATIPAPATTPSAAPVSAPTQAAASVPASSSKPAETPADDGASWPLLCCAVLDDTGAPVVGARVLLADLDLGARTDKRGHFCIAAPPGDRTLSVVAMGFAAHRQTISLGTQTQEIEIRLQPAP